MFVALSRTSLPLWDLLVVCVAGGTDWYHTGLGRRCEYTQEPYTSLCSCNLGQIIFACSQLAPTGRQHQSLYCLALVADQRGLAWSLLQSDHCTTSKDNRVMICSFCQPSLHPVYSISATASHCKTTTYRGHRHSERPG